MNKPLKFILNRNYSEKEKTYINLFSNDDKKKSNKNYNEFFEIKPENYNQIIDECDRYNFGSLGVFISLNPLSSTTRKKAFVKNINFIFIDLDNANEDDYKGVKEFLESKGIKISYIAKSGSGYHLIIEIDMSTTEENKVKKFLNYLHSNISSKVDTSTGDLTRLLRVPESRHYKREEFELKTLYLKPIKAEEYKKNNELVLSMQLKEEKTESNMNYLIEVKREDIFFSDILNKSNLWGHYRKILNESGDRNPYFIKNLGFFIASNYKYKDKAIEFLKQWESARIKSLEGWIKKAYSENCIVNYYELLKWATEQKIDEFIKLLNDQTKETILDSYEIYYLEEEKSESNCILYFPSKNYYVQKSIQEVILNIYYDCKEKGLDLEKELNMSELYDDWKKLPFKKQMFLVLDQIRRLLESENRMRLIYNINYSPSDEKFIFDENKKFFNIYKKTHLLSLPITEIEEYDYRNIKKLIMNLCGQEKEYYNWFIQWLAWQVQYPTSKLPTAVIFQGEQGTGKGVLKTHVLDMIFGNNCQEINQTHLESSFNEYLLGKQIIVANEVMHNENRQTLPNVLKNLVTDELITIRRKFRKELVIRNYTHWIFCTNSDNPIKIEEGDRRYSVFKSKKLEGGGVKARKFVKALIENKEHELPHFLTYLKNLELDEFLISMPIETQAKKDIIELNSDSCQRFLEYLKGFSKYRDAYYSIFDNDKDLGLINSGDGFEYIKTESLYLLYLNWSKKYGERAVFNKQNFGRRVISYNICNQTKKYDGKTIRAYPLELLDNIIRGKENDSK